MSDDLVLPSFAKINLGLRVLGRRADGFHEIFTVFQTISLHDNLRFNASDEIAVKCDSPGVPSGESNLIHMALRALQSFSGTTKGLEVTLEKHIPSPGGLGGGSSNAAIALIGAKRVWELDISTDQLAMIGKKIGSDVPFFLYGGTAIGTGRGTEIEQVEDVAKTHVLVVSSDIDVATEKAYQTLDAPDLTTTGSKRILRLCRKEAKRLYTGEFELQNDFESVIFGSYPEIENVAEKLKTTGATNVLLSGSGPSVFALFEKADDVHSAAKLFKGCKNVSCYNALTVSRGSYFESLGLSRE